MKKKFILAAAAAGALAFGGAASAQDLGQVLSNILGLGQPTYNQGQVYVDQWGRQVYLDQYGRQVLVPGSNVGAHGGTPIGTSGWEFAGYDNQGRALYRNPEGFYTLNPPIGGGYAYSGQTWDRDGDGVADNRDRWPDDRRYR